MSLSATDNVDVSSAAAAQAPHRQPDGGIYLVRANYFQKLKTVINSLLLSFLKAQSDPPFLCLCPSFVGLQQIMERCRKQSNTCNFVGAFMPFEMAIKYTICPFLTPLKLISHDHHRRRDFWESHCCRHPQISQTLSAAKDVVLSFFVWSDGHIVRIFIGSSAQ